MTPLLNAITAEQQKFYDRLQFQLYGYTNAGPCITSTAWAGSQFSCTLTQAASYALWRCDDVTTAFWSRVTNAVATTNGTTVTLKDAAPPAGLGFYSVVR